MIAKRWLSAFLKQEEGCYGDRCQSDSERRNDFARDEAEKQIRRLDSSTKAAEKRATFPIADMIRHAER